ncbi:hypothetical protein RRG08_045460 [Elysia crispata]|uniref:Uncharacterized protein n=1 Tax=Elysia crispata TaxID=231223 RepID=A0AAE1AWT7_9GAST|nr:hypothetical protein RRG08_045460 [Elysia crispata]
MPCLHHRPITCQVRLEGPNVAHKYTASLPPQNVDKMALEEICTPGFDLNPPSLPTRAQQKEYQFAESSNPSLDYSGQDPMMILESVSISPGHSANQFKLDEASSSSQSSASCF